MAGADKIIAIIEEEYQNKIKQLQAETDADVKEINDAENAKLKTEIDTLKAANNERITIIQSNAKYSAESVSRKQQLSVKREKLEQAFDNALNKTKAFSNDQKKSYAKNIVLSIASGDEEFVASDSVFDSAFIGELNSALAAKGKKNSLTLVKSDKQLDGFILRKGGMTMNCTYESVINDLKDTIDIDVAKILFEV